MTARSIRRALERKQKKLAHKAEQRTFSQRPPPPTASQSWNPASVSTLLTTTNPPPRFPPPASPRIAPMPNSPPVRRRSG